MRLFVLAIITSCAVGPSWADAKSVQLSSDLPNFAPRASAKDILCRSTTSTTLFGKAGTSKAVAVGVVSSTPPKADWDSIMRIRFDAGHIHVSIGLRDKAGTKWGPDFDYIVNNDAPQDFFATRVGSAEMGMAQFIALNRVTGTAISTMLMASLGQDAHPSVGSTFHVCETYTN